jgi:hypothetical protein
VCVCDLGVVSSLNADSEDLCVLVWGHHVCGREGI